VRRFSMGRLRFENDLADHPAIGQALPRGTPIQQGITLPPRRAAATWPRLGRPGSAEAEAYPPLLACAGRLVSQGTSSEEA
jgi:hypothetical protein